MSARHCLDAGIAFVVCMLGLGSAQAATYAEANACAQGLCDTSGRKPETATAAFVADHSNGRGSAGLASGQLHVEGATDVDWAMLGNRLGSGANASLSADLTFSVEPSVELDSVPLTFGFTGYLSASVNFPMSPTESYAMLILSVSSGQYSNSRTIEIYKEGGCQAISADCFNASGFVVGDDFFLPIRGGTITFSAQLVSGASNGAYTFSDVNFNMALPPGVSLAPTPFLSAVPEPSTPVTMALGLLVIGATLRIRGRAVKPTLDSTDYGKSSPTVPR